MFWVKNHIVWVNLLFLALLFGARGAMALSYQWFVNGDSTATVAFQGDSVVLEIILDEVGDEVIFSYVHDINSNGIFDAEDFVIVSRKLSDGGERLIENLPNLSPEFDGKIQLYFDPFYPTPGSFMITCMQGTSVVASPSIDVRPPYHVPHVISGRVSLEGIDPPDERLADIYVWGSIMRFMSPVGMGGYTDEFGNFTINCPTADTSFAIIPYTEIPGYVTPNYQLVNVSGLGDTTHIEFTYSRSPATVYGEIRLDSGEIAPLPAFIMLHNNDGFYLERFMIFTDGEYSIGFQPGRYQVELVRECLPAGFFAPPRYSLNLSEGDSVRLDLTIQRATENITGRVTESGGAPSKSYLIRVEGYMDASASALTGVDGYYSVSVPSSSNPFNVEIQTDPMSTPLSTGHVVDGTNRRSAYAGDVVNFDIVPAGQSISGEISLAEGLEPEFNWAFFEATLFDTNWVSVASSPIQPDGSFEVACLPGVYHLQMHGPYGIMFYPYNYLNISIEEGSSLTGMDFTLHYSRYLAKITLSGANPDSVAEQYLHIRNGPWFDCMTAGVNLFPGDTFFTVGLTADTWTLRAPIVHGHGALEDSAVFTVGPSDSIAEVTFNYHEGVCAWIFGDLSFGMAGPPIPDDIYIIFHDLNRGMVDSVRSTSGHYEFATFPGRYQLRTSYSLLDREPPWLMPPHWISSFFIVEPGFGDTLVRNLTIYEADTALWVELDEDDGLPSRYYKFRAQSNEMGMMIRHTDAFGRLEMPIADGPGLYRITMELGDTPAPEGLFVEGPPWWGDCMPGDSIFVKLTPFENWVTGRIIRSTGFDEDLANFFVTAESETLSLSPSRARKDGQFYKAVPRGRWRISLRGLDTAMWTPHEYELTMHTVDIHDIEFTVRNKTCRVEATINGVLPEDIHESFAECFGGGDFPNCYYARPVVAEGETSFSFSLCSEVWRISAPVIPEFEADDVHLTISDGDTLVEIEFDYRYTSVDEAHKPVEWSLGAYPNPFNPSATLVISIAQAGNVLVEIFDIMGRKVTTLIDDKLSEGVHDITWNSTEDNPSGIYLLRMQTIDGILSAKLLLLR